MFLLVHISFKFFNYIFILDRCRSYEFRFIPPSVCLITFVFFPDNCSKDCSGFMYGYGALWVGWSNRALFHDKIQIWPIIAKNGQKQPKITLFQTLTKNDFKEFSELLHNDSRDDSVPSWTNCMPRKLLADEIRGTFEYNTK